MIEYKIYRDLSFKFDKKTNDVIEYQNCFWKKMKTIKDSKESRNGYRLYIPFNTTLIARYNYDQYFTYMNNKSNKDIAFNVKKFIENWAFERDFILKDFDYINGIITILNKSKKLCTYKIGKLLNKNIDGRKLLNDFSNDNDRLNKNVLNKLKLVISKHPYDILGASTGRDWTSCLNLNYGECWEELFNHIKYGSFVVYIINENDENIKKPLGRIFLNPWEIQVKGKIGFERRKTTYIPEPTIYSSYTNIEPIHDYLLDICKNFTPEHGKLIKKKNLYYDNYFNKNINEI